jgi:RNA polymerase sigma factor (sigma-70 family)
MSGSTPQTPSPSAWAAVSLATKEEFTAHVGPHLPAVLAIARRLAPGSPDDVVQETLLSAWRYKETYAEEKGSFRTWLLTIAVRESRREARRTLRQLLLLRRADQTSTAAGASGDEQGRLEAAIARLSRRQREVVNLHYFVDLPVAEVAAALGVSDGTVKSTLSDARRNLRTMLEGERDGH